MSRRFHSDKIDVIYCFAARLRWITTIISSISNEKNKEDIFVYFSFKLTQTQNELQTEQAYERMLAGFYRSRI